MTERRIFEILLKSKKNDDYSYDFPKLQAEAVNIAADSFTEIICETLKQKSTASHLKRGNILKYIHIMCGVKPLHLNEDSFECFLKILRKSLHSDETEDVLKLIRDIHCELESEVPRNLADKVVDFYRRKNIKQNEKAAKLEFISKKNQEKLDLKCDMQVRKNYSYYEVSENVIRELLGRSDTDLLENKSLTNQVHSVEYRQKQIKFGYALVNLKNSDLYLIERIFQRLSTYKKLEPFEVNFLLYLWFLEDGTLDFSPIISDKFPLVVERLILKYATKILEIKEDIELYQYFTNLESDKKMAKIRRSCAENIILYKTMRSLIYELYCYSFCNENVLKLLDFLQ